MKIKCDFCKTEYTLDKVSSGGVKCAICGNVWAPDVAPRKNTWLMFFASLCALLSAIVFTVAIIHLYNFFLILYYSTLILFFFLKKKNRQKFLTI